MDHKIKIKYELVPPDGGWGYIIAFAVMLMMLVSVMPMTCFGIIYGEFMEELGDAASNTAIVTTTFFTVFSFTGFLSNYLLLKHPRRIVGMIGSTLFCIGTFSTIFARTMIQIMVSLSLIQGLGYGILLPTCFSSLSLYFKKRKNFVVCTSLTVLTATATTYPSLTAYSMSNYGFRGTLAILSALSLNLYVSVLLLQPVEWHMKKNKLEDIELVSANTVPYKNEDSIKPEAEALLTLNTSPIDSKNNRQYTTFWQKVSKNFSLDLFSNFVFINIAAGIALATCADLAFLSLIPILLNDRGFSSDEITTLMSVYFAGDLAGRFSLSVLTAFVKINNRNYFTIGCIIPATLRTGFLLNNNFLFLAAVLIFLGLCRCLVQSLNQLVIAEAFPLRFSEAYPLALVVQGGVSLVVGPLISFAKTATGSNEAVVHLLTASYLACAIPWILEKIYFKVKKSNKLENINS